MTRVSSSQRLLRAFFLVYLVLQTRVEAREGPTASAAAQAQASLQLTIEVVGMDADDAASIEAQVRLRAREAAITPELLLVMTHGRRTVEVPARVGWELEVTAPGLWAPRRILSPLAPSSHRAETLTLWPAGRIEGQLQLSQANSGMPKELAVRMISPPLTPSPPGLPRVVLTDCALGEAGRFRCPAPAGTFDLAIQVPGFVPEYRWGKVVAAERSLDLGALSLRNGSSVSGYVVTTEGAIDPTHCTARLVPADSPGAPTPAGRRMASATQEAQVSADGFFQVAGVAAGTYSLEIEQPGFAIARRRPVAVWANSETFLREPILLAPPFTLELQLVPELDWLGEPWAVEISRAAPGGSWPDEPIHRGRASHAGRVELPHQSLGRFAVRVKDSAGSVLLAQDFDLKGPADSFQRLEVPFVTVRGRVRHDGKPLAARLYFGGRFGRERALIAANEKGEFEGVLGREGRWLVAVEATLPRLTTQLWTEVTRDSDGVAELELTVSTARVFGRVVSPDPRLRLEPTRVALSSHQVQLLGEMSPDGGFEVSGVPEGSAELAASLSVGGTLYTSPRREVEVEEGEAVGPIELLLQPGKIASGSVIGPRGPIPGASIAVLPWEPTDRGDTTQADWEGKFSVAVGGQAHQAVVSVMAPGHAFKVFLAPLDGSPWVLNIPQEGGTLVLSLPIDFEAEKPAQRPVSFWHGPTPLSPPRLIEWQEAHGLNGKWQGEVQLPAMAPGEYRVCQPSERKEASVAEEPNLVCNAGILSPGGVLRLEARPR